MCSVPPHQHGRPHRLAKLDGRFKKECFMKQQYSRGLYNKPLGGLCSSRKPAPEAYPRGGSTMNLALNCWGLMALIACSETSDDKLRCYQCNVTDVTACSEDYLKECPDSEDFDSCQTRVRKNGNGDRWVEKSCVRGPCNLSWEEERSLGMACDYSAPTYDCVVCCKEDGCNTGNGESLHDTSLVLMTMSTATFLYFLSSLMLL